MLSNYIKKVKIWCGENQKDLFTASIIFVTGLSGFGLGRLSVDLRPHPPLALIQPADNSETATSSQTAASLKKSAANVFASRNGSVYYYSWCPGAKRTKEENKIWFQTAKEAEQAGLTRANGCNPY